MSNEEVQKFWRKARLVKPGTWFIYKGRDYFKDKDGTVFERRGPILLDLQDPEKKLPRRPRMSRIMAGSSLLPSKSMDRIFSEVKEKTETEEIITAVPASKRTRLRKE